MGEIDVSWLDDKDDTAWLDQSESQQAVVDILNDDFRTPAAFKTLPVKDTVAPEYRELVLALRACTVPMRKYLRALVAAKGSPHVAARQCGVTVNTTWRWRRNPTFIHARKLLLQQLAEESGVDPFSVVTGIRSVIDDALTPVPMINNGEPVQDPVTGEYLYEVDRANALRGFENLAKINGQMREASISTRTVVQLIELDGHKTEEVVSEQ